MNSCFTCKYRNSVREEESWEMPWIYWWEHTCTARPTISNLKQFPFNQTNCQKWEQSDIKRNELLSSP